MKFLEYVNENEKKMALIDKLRNTIKDINHEEIKKEFKNTTSEDRDKLSLMLECNLMGAFVDSEDITTISLEDVKNIIGGCVGFFHLLNGIEKNKRESYTEILWDVLYQLFSDIEDEEDLCHSSNIVKRVYEAFLSVESGDSDENNLKVFHDNQLEQCVSDIYKYLLKDKLEF